MEWDVYKDIRALTDAKAPREALAMIAARRDETAKIRSFVACLEAACYEQLGDRGKALETLLRATAEPPNDNFWVHHAQAALFRTLGRMPESIEATRRGQASLGWMESQQRGYVFLHDFFSANIPDWTRWFHEFVTSAPIQILEIGSWQGGSSTWLLDKIIAPRGGRLTCVDTFEGSSEHAGWIGGIGDRIEDIFDRNVSLSAAAGQCRKIVGKSQDVLRTLFQERFDFIYIDGAHEARFVIEDAVLAFGLLSSPGYLLFDDYDFKFEGHPERNTAQAIDAFVSLYRDEIEVLAKGRQFLLRKT
jgi:predicted O-methyltransferase YrrM